MQALPRTEPCHVGRLHIYDLVRPDDPAMTCNPLRFVPNYLTEAVPLVLHGDGIALTNKKQAVCDFSGISSQCRLVVGNDLDAGVLPCRKPHVP